MLIRKKKGRKKKNATQFDLDYTEGLCGQICCKMTTNPKGMIIPVFINSRPNYLVLSEGQGFNL